MDIKRKRNCEHFVIVVIFTLLPLAACFFVVLKRWIFV